MKVIEYDTRIIKGYNMIELVNPDEKRKSFRKGVKNNNIERFPIRIGANAASK